jgi:predicted nucleic acid-binding protein
MTADTSVIVAAVMGWHDQHETSARALVDVEALPAHAVLEAYSVITRLPGGLAVQPAEAVALLDDAAAGRPLALSPAERHKLVGRLADAGISGGASYDALIGLESLAHGETLMTLDRRALETYSRLGVSARLLASAA